VPVLGLNLAPLPSCDTRLSFGRLKPSLSDFLSPREVRDLFLWSLLAGDAAAAFFGFFPCCPFVFQGAFVCLSSLMPPRSPSDQDCELERKIRAGKSGLLAPCPWRVVFPPFLPGKAFPFYAMGVFPVFPLINHNGSTSRSLLCLPSLLFFPPLSFLSSSLPFPLFFFLRYER